MTDPLNNLDPEDLDAVIEYAVAVATAGEWSPDVADVLASMVVTNHGDAGLAALAEAVEAALAARE